MGQVELSQEDTHKVTVANPGFSLLGYRLSRVSIDFLLKLTFKDFKLYIKKPYGAINVLYQPRY